MTAYFAVGEQSGHHLGISAHALSQPCHRQYHYPHFETHKEESYIPLIFARVCAILRSIVFVGFKSMHQALEKRIVFRKQHIDQSYSKATIIHSSCRTATARHGRCLFSYER